MENKQSFHEYFKDLRSRKQISLREFCRKSGADPANISRMERGLIGPPKSQAILERYADYLGLEKSSGGWMLFFDLAMAAKGVIPMDIMSDKNLSVRLPVFFSNLRRDSLKYRMPVPRKRLGVCEGASPYAAAGKPDCFIIAGSNGSGKTTFAREFLPNYAGCTNFINPDLIASGISPFKPENAVISSGRIVLQQIYENSLSGRSFSIETTLSGRTYFNVFSDLKTRGYQLHMFYLWIPTPDMAIRRIKQRVENGGHDVPSKDVLRRFDRTLSNLFNIYLPIIDSLKFFDNSQETPILVFEETNRRRKIINHEKYSQIRAN